jgi:predicted O-methyltransferase YrrM
MEKLMDIQNKILSGHVYDAVRSRLESSQCNYLEIGLFNGFGFATIANENPHIKFVGVDPFIEDGHTIGTSGATAGSRISQQQASCEHHIADLTNVELNIMTSHEFLQSLTKEKIDAYNIGTVIIDGNHHYEYVVNDYKLAMMVIDHRPGVIVFDDIAVSGVSQAYQEFCTQHSDRIDRTVNVRDVAQMVYLKSL